MSAFLPNSGHRAHDFRHALHALTALVLLAAPLRPAVAQDDDGVRMRDEIRAHLDDDGSFYLYMELEDAFSGTVAKLETLKGSNPQMAMAAHVIQNLITSTGVDGIGGLGASLLTVEPGVNRLRIYLPHGEPRGVFSLRGGEPGLPTPLQYVPADASFVLTHNLEYSRLIPLIEEVIVRVAGPGPLAAFRSEAGPLMLLSTLGDEFGGYLRLDTENPVSLPGDRGQRFSVPGVGFVIAVELQSRVLLDMLYQQMGQNGVQVSPLTVEGLSGNAIGWPPNPFNIAPVIVENDNWVLFASSREELVHALTNGGQLASNPDFARLANHSPDAINDLRYIAPEFNRALSDLLLQVRRMSNDPEADVMLALISEAVGDHDVGKLSVRINHAGAIEWVTVGDVSTGEVAAILAAGPSFPVMVAIAVPGFIRAREASRTRKIQADLRRIDDANQEYAMMYNLEGGERPPSIEDLVELGYLRVLPTPPVEGSYRQAMRVLAPGESALPEGYPSFDGPNPNGDRVHPDLLP